MEGAAAATTCRRPRSPLNTAKKRASCDAGKKCGDAENLGGAHPDQIWLTWTRYGANHISVHCCVSYCGAMSVTG